MIELGNRKTKTVTTLRGLALTISVAVGLSFSSTSLAIPVLWTLTAVEFDDLGTATGSFVYDADTNTYSAIDVTTSGGTLPGATFSDLVLGTALDALVVADAGVDLTGEPGFQFVFLGPLTNSGGAIDMTLFGDPFFSSFEETCLNAGCTSATLERSVISGGVIGVPTIIPLPAAGWLFCGAISLAVGLRRSRAMSSNSIGLRQS